MPVVTGQSLVFLLLLSVRYLENNNAINLSWTEPF